MPEVVFGVGNVNGFSAADKVKEVISSILGVTSVDLRLDVADDIVVVKVSYDGNKLRPDKIKQEIKRANFRLIALDKKKKKLFGDILMSQGW